MNKLAAFRIGLALAVALGSSACKDNNDVAGSRGSLASVQIDAPDSARSGVDFEVTVNATSVGVSNIRDARVDVTFDAPLIALSAEASTGTSAAVAGSRVTWMLGTLDSNSQSRLHVRVRGILAPGEGNRSARIRAELTGQRISAGEAVATDFVTISP